MTPVATTMKRWKRDIRGMGIGTKLVSLLCASAILASCAIGLMTYWQFSETLIDKELNSICNSAQVIGARFITRMAALRDDATFLSNTAAVQDWARTREEANAVNDSTQKQLLSRLAITYLEMLRAKPQYYQIRLIGLTDGGREVVRAERDLRTNGLRIVPKTELQQKGKEPYFQNTIRLPQGEVYLSEINLNREHSYVEFPETPVIRAALPIYGANQKVVGLIIINRLMEPVFDELRQCVKSDHILMLTNSRGEYLMHPDPSHTFGSQLGNSWTVQKEYPPVQQALLHSQSTQQMIVERTPHHKRAVLQVYKVHFDPSDPARFVAVVLAVPYDHVIADSALAARRSLIIGGIILMLSLALGYAFSRSLTKPLRSIAAAAEAFGQGDSGTDLPTDARDETGVVARSLRRMMDQVQARTDSLQAEVIERERAEAAMREQAARIQAILDAAVDAIITMDEEGIVESLNPAAERLFGYTPAELVGSNVRVLMPELHHIERDGYLVNYRTAEEEEAIGIGREVVGRRKNGTTFPMHLAVSAFALRGQRMFTGIARDITDLKNAVRQLRESESRTQAILDTAADGIITIDQDGNIEAFNTAAEKIFGQCADDVIGKSVNILMPTPFSEEHDQHIRDYLRTGISHIIGIGREVVGLKADGTIFPLELAVSEVRLGDRTVFTGIARDITELKRILHELHERNDKLATQAREIDRFNLVLRRSNEELSQFAYVASHDLQEPLRKVTAFCQALQEDYNDKLDDTARGYIQYAVEGARRMKSLVVDLLSYSRVQSQGKPLEPTDANEACDEAIQNLAAAIEDAKAEVIRTDLPAVDADRAQLVRLFQNLIGNAIKYRGKEVPRIQIDVEELCDECLFRVSDNGIGIDPQYHKRIFVIFQRLHAREQYSGTGIGLAVCKRIVERAGGRIWVESAAGAGSVFCFTLTKSHDLERIGAMPHDHSDQQLIEAVD